MNGIIKTMKSDVPIYGTHEANFLIENMDTQKANDLAKYLFGGLEKSDKNIGWNVYDAVWKQFSKDDVWGEDGCENLSREYLESQTFLRINLFRGHNVFLLSEILDTKESAGTSLGTVFHIPGKIASLETISEGTLLNIKHWSEGVPFDASFLYNAGEKFGKRLDGSLNQTQSQ